MNKTNYENNDSFETKIGFTDYFIVVLVYIFV